MESRTDQELATLADSTKLDLLADAEQGVDRDDADYNIHLKTEALNDLDRRQLDLYDHFFISLISFPALQLDAAESSKRMILMLPSNRRLREQLVTDALYFALLRFLIASSIPNRMSSKASETQIALYGYGFSTTV